MNSGREIGPAPRGQPRSLTGNLAGVAVGVREEEESGPVPGPDVPRFLNRELSRLDFDERVLAMAEDTKLPLLERVRFLAIFSSNLDDFFQVRVAGLKEQVLAAVAVASPDGMTPLEQLRAIRLRVEGLIQRQTSIFNSEIVPALATAGITFVRGEDVTKKELSQLHSVFRQQIFPVLTPLAVDPAHPFPYISHLSLNLAVIVRDPQRHQQRFARVKVPPVLPRLVPLAEGERYIPMEDVIALHLQSLFPGMEIVDHHPFRVTRSGDLLAQHPYDSFATSVEAFIDHAASDPNVLAIKQTLYRTSGPASPIVRALIRAAEAGKQVVALVELKARGDEQANIAWARALEEANVHVVYGLVGLKTHAKVTSVVRREGRHIQHYVHVGTGNYNPSTAHQYEDVSLLSADPDLGADVTELFNLLTGYSRQNRYRKLLVAPTNLRPDLAHLIERERKPGGRIVIKVNNLVDPDLIDALYQSSQEGAEVDLIVRSMCSLRPGVPGVSERIRVRSIVGRFLEHSRIFSFGRGEDAELYLGSSDLMPRNLDRRVEVVVPVTDSLLSARLQSILDVCLADDVLAWELSSDGSWSKVPTVAGLNSHRRFQELALDRARSNGAASRVTHG